MVDHHFHKKYTSTYIRYNLVWDTCLGDTPLLVGFIDFDLVGHPNYWKSIACCALILCSRPLNWARKKKQTLDISSIEEEH